MNAFPQDSQAYMHLDGSTGSRFLVFSVFKSNAAVSPPAIVAEAELAKLEAAAERVLVIPEVWGSI